MCGFDGDMCGFTQPSDDGYDWIRRKGATPTPLTGPDHDHTTGTGMHILLLHPWENVADVQEKCTCNIRNVYCRNVPGFVLETPFYSMMWITE